MTQKFYKVVRCEKCGLVSARMNKECQFFDGINAIKIHYRIKRWVKPKIEGSKIFVFHSIDSAQDFICTSSFDIDSGEEKEKEHIYECEVRNPTVATIACNSIHQITRFWNGDMNVVVMEPPKGTYYCDAVKLIQRIQ